MELNLAQVFGAASTSMHAMNVKGPASILIIFMRYPLNRPADRYRAGAPAASHAAIAARSEPVISVILPGGIALDHAACGQSIAHCGGCGQRRPNGSPSGPLPMSATRAPRHGTCCIVC